jgi:hypothetical protein
MVENKKEKELTKEEKLEKVVEYLKLNAIEIGEDYISKIERGGYRFTIKPPSVVDDYKILKCFHEIKNELGINDIPLSPIDEYPLRVLSTLNYVITKLEIKKERKDKSIEWEAVNSSFWEYFKEKIGVQSFYENIVFPLNEDYLNFREAIDLSVDDIKKN